METRKVQQTGKTSFTITLPKEWIVKNNISKNQSLFMKTLQDGSLLINPQPIEEGMQKFAVFEIDQTADPQLLFRNLLGAYVSGSTSFKIIGKGKIPSGSKEIIKKFVKRLEGLEITEENVNSIYIREEKFFTLRNFKRLFESMAAITDDMMKVMIDILESQAVEKIEEIIRQDDEVNQKFWQMYHMSHLSFSLPVYIHHSLAKISSLYSISLEFEQIGDFIVQFGEVLQDLGFENLPAKIRQKFIYILNNLHQNLVESINVVESEDLEKSHDIYNQSQILRDICNSMYEEIPQYSTNVIYFFRLVESLKNVARKFQNLGEILNNFISA